MRAQLELALNKLSYELEGIIKHCLIKKTSPYVIDKAVMEDGFKVSLGFKYMGGKTIKVNSHS